MEKINLSKQEILDRIGYFRAKKKKSAYKLGIELGHSKNYFYRIESGEIVLTVDLLLEVLEILGVTTSEFFAPELDINNKDYIHLVERYKQISTENQKTIMDLINNLR